MADNRLSLQNLTIAQVISGFLHVNGSGVVSSQATISLTTEVSGILPIANGGTGQATASAAFAALSPLSIAGDLIYENVSPAPARLAIGSSGQLLTVVGGLPAWASPATSGTVTSVALTSPGILYTVSGSPITSSGTLALNLISQSQNFVLAGPTSGSGNPSFRALVSGDLPSNQKQRSISIAFDGGGGVIQTGKVIYLANVPYSGTITSAQMIADVSGSIVIDVWKTSYSGAPPTVANTIVDSTPPTLSSAQKSQDTTLSGWTTSITAGDVMAFKVNSASTVKFVSLVLTVSAS